jgi:RNA polymerase primary sigma factor
MKTGSEKIGRLAQRRFEGARSISGRDIERCLKGARMMNESNAEKMCRCVKSMQREGRLAEGARPELFRQMTLATCSASAEKEAESVKRTETEPTALGTDEYMKARRDDEESMDAVLDSSMLSFLETAGTFKVLPEEELVRLARIYKADPDGEEGIEARNRIVEHNMRLVVMIAKEYSKHGMPLQDLIQEGIIGLMRAVEKYDFDRFDSKFITYAQYWVRQKITRALSNKGRLIRLPVLAGDKISKMFQARDRAKAKLEREPTTEEIAKEMGGAQFTADWVEEMLQDSMIPTSLSSLGSSDDTHEVRCYDDMISDRNQEGADELVDQEEEDEAVDRMLMTLEPKERKTMMLRFGISSGAELSQQQTADRMGVTLAEERAVESRALRKLRHPGRSRMVKMFR